ncbi:MAG: peptidoglycan editing factor PgeF [Holosporales bacterium]|jgi:YfiH family protein|nr:peptidoglycan editing factor PgeF [Holosporales bacterium]
MNKIQSDLLTEINFIDHGFFDRTGGASSGPFESLNVGLHKGDDVDTVLQNRRKIADHFGVSLEDMIILNQQHSDTVHVIDDKNVEAFRFKNAENFLSNKATYGDAIITYIKGLLIGVNTADCAPILLCDKDAMYIAAVHAGWKGAVGNIIENTIAKMKELGCKNIVAAIGPCIQKRYFAVGNEVTSVVERRYLSHFEGKTQFDMQLLILDKLMKEGVRTVSKLNIDTMTNRSYFSHRRQAGNCGVQFSGIIVR